MTSADDLGHQDVLGGLAAGAEADPHAGHSHADPLRPAADLSVRPAVPEDAAAIGDVHARTLRASLAAGVGHDLGPEIAAAIDPAALGASWAAAIEEPPSPRHRVLTALAGARVVGFAAFAPAEVPVELRATGADGSVDDADGSVDDADGSVDDAADDAVDGAAPGAVAEILALEVPAAHARRGHGSRLLAACADLLRQQGAARVQTWTVQADESRTRFLGQAGFAPAGLRRSLDVGGEEVVEICWYADL
ncbi:GNAT family N-acetyltransferase [Georgenia sp. EYE_87]|uniref:GNAT family N-acetyltransferase n=1 Tax=Georgenia sp. EYE_87 TaxID=2853448 RepID=UPI0020049A25|nr:GNAT family N-acetyltransferase [Georgenia sp. EYE_87]MCK6212357.1 GNAT family N-acetyltransferase [Georgenia sp. EYE_87]